jgi:hypothetical protein
VITINKDINNNLVFLNIIKYFSFIYDEIVILSIHNLDYLKQYFEYDITILFNSTVETELLDYKCKVIIEEKEYTKNEYYNLFNISEYEINILI